jgi:hypothetical protein
MIDSLEVRWPSGLRQVFEHVPADRISRLVEGRTLTSFQVKEGRR